MFSSWVSADISLGIWSLFGQSFGQSVCRFLATFLVSHFFGWSVCHMVTFLVSQSVDRSVCRLVSLLVGQSFGWSVCRLVSVSFGHSVVWSVCCLVTLLVSQSFGGSVCRLVTYSSVNLKIIKHLVSPILLDSRNMLYFVTSAQDSLSQQKYFLITFFVFV